MKSIKLLVMIIVISLRFTYAQTWDPISQTVTTKTLNKICFIDSTKGIVVGSSGTIIKTTDCGNTWELKTSGTTRQLNSIVYANNSLHVVGASGIYLSSTDEGETWVSKTLTTNNSNTLYAINKAEDNLFATGNGRIIKSTDNGTTWEQIRYGSTTTPLMRNICFVSNNYGYVVGNGAAILRTTDGGATFDSLKIGTQDFYSIDFADSLTGVAVGWAGSMYRTTNAGQSWEPIAFTTTNNLYNVKFFNSNNGIITGGNGTILVTHNGGLTWEDNSLTEDPTSLLWGVCIVNNNVVLVVGNSGKIYKTLTAGMPVELVNFAAQIIDGKINLFWQTATETNNYKFEVERCEKAFVLDWFKIGEINGNGTSTSINSYSFVDNNANTGNYLYRLKQIDYDGSYQYSKSINVSLIAPLEFSLKQNYPNPFNPSTTISYTIASVCDVKIIVYDIIGKAVTELVNSRQEAGTYNINFNAKVLSSGIYFAKISAGNFSKTIKMNLIK